MRTLIVSDLHVGLHTGADVLRRPVGLDALVGALDGVDRLVLLGDAIELRSGPVGRALEAARPFFEALGRALDGREVVLVPGNHDHALIGSWLQRGDGVFDPEQRALPEEASPAACAIADFLGPRGRIEFAYPGIWVRDDVYATHGHYLDCHMTVPTFERLAIAAMARFARIDPAAVRRPDDYEALVAPVYAWIHAVAQGGQPGLINGSGSARARHALTSSAGRLRLRSRAAAAAFPVAVAALNRAGFGPLRSDVSGDELRRARLLALGCVVDRLGIDAEYVIFGHTHRTGPLPGDDPSEWVTPSGAHLLNCGSWVFETHLMTPAVAASPYWPGGAVTVDGDGPPRLERLLGERGAAELVASRRASLAGVSSSRVGE
ncbi:MAG: metallophosphoesterase [Solirubrobacteraceae bacterium]